MTTNKESLHNIILDNTDRSKINPHIIESVGYKAELRGFVFEFKNTNWSISYTKTPRGDVFEELKTIDGTIFLKLIIEKYVPTAFFINNKKYEIDDSNIEFAINSFPFLNDYCFKNKYFYSKNSITSNSNKPSYFNIFLLNLKGVFKRPKQHKY